MQTEDYIDFESREANVKIANVEMTGFDMHFYCLDFLVASRVVAFNLDGRTFMFQFQAEDRDFDELLLVFEAIATSLISNIASPGEPQA